MNSNSGHDFIENGKYNKICACVKCVETYDKWCRKNKEDGATICKRKRIVKEEIVCEKPVTTLYEWGHTNVYEGKWERHHALPVPKNCDSCKKPASKCGCKKPNIDLDIDRSISVNVDRRGGDHAGHFHVGPSRLGNARRGFDNRY